KESGFTFERGFDATPVTKPGLHGRKYPRDFLRSVKKEGFGRIAAPVNGRDYIRYNGGDSYTFASHPTGGGGVLVPRYSAAMKGGHGNLRRGATIETSSPELQKIFGSNRWKIMDTGGGLRRWQIDCYFGEDEPLGPGKFAGRPRHHDARKSCPVDARSSVTHAFDRSTRILSAVPSWGPANSRGPPPF